MQFPYPRLREQQKELMNDVRNAVDNSKHLLVDAPTGSGKTIGVLYPCIEYAIENDKNIFFLTSRHSQHKMAIETLQKLMETRVNVTDIIGKKWLCSYESDKMDNSVFSNFCESMVKNNHCVFLSATREKNDLKELAAKTLAKLRQNISHAEEFKAYAGSKFCAYELLMEAAKNSNVIVGDYFHIFSPVGKGFLKRINKDIEDSIIIVDEAHNLPARIRDRLSSKLSLRTIRFAFDEAEEFGYNEIGDQLKQLQNVFNELKKRLDEQEMFITKNDLLDQIPGDLKQLIEDFRQAGSDVLKEKRRSSIDNIASFLDNWQGQDIGYARILSADDKEVMVFYNCLDPSIISKSIIDQSHSTILMSGTLHPMEMYSDILGFEKQRTVYKSYSSPFPRENRLNIIVDNITTLYKERNEETFRNIAQLIRNCSEHISGNAAIFFPSYELMRRTINATGILKKEMIIESQNMSKKEKTDLYHDFASYADKGGAVLFAVIAGSFSEGIDLPGELLNGVVVIGLPLERPTKNTEALIDYYQHLFSKGQEYGYTYPAMIKVIQAAGRCIRTENDRGVCIFADKRYLWNTYRRLLPLNMKVTSNPVDMLIRFFSK